MKKPYELWGTRENKFQMLASYSTLSKLRNGWTEHHSLPDVSGPFKAKTIVDDGRIDISDQMPLLVLKEYTSAEERDNDIIKHAKYFTIVRFLGVGKYERHERDKKEEALTLGDTLSKQNKGNYLIYAVNDRNLSALVTTIIYKGRG